MEPKHCWHFHALMDGTDTTLVHQEVCCYCAVLREVTYLHKQVDGHGPHHLAFVKVGTKGGEHPCAGRRRALRLAEASA